MDKVIEKVRELLATKTGRAVVALLVATAVIAYAHHRGESGAEAKAGAEIEQLKKQLAAKPEVILAPAKCEAPIEGPADADLARRLQEAETAKNKLEKKVSDYEKQLARKPAKAGALLCLPLTLAACQTFNEASPEERIDISACLRLAQTVELPPIKAGMDARAVIARYRAALINANANITDTKACVALLDRAETKGHF